MPIIFDRKIARSILSTLASAISGSSFARGTSFLKDALNKKIFNENINIIAEPGRFFVSSSHTLVANIIGKKSKNNENIFCKIKWSCCAYL